MVNQLCWLHLSTCIQSITLALVFNPNWMLFQNVSGIAFSHLSQLPIDLSALWTGRFSLYDKLVPLWPKQDLLPYGMPYPPLCVPPYFLVHLQASKNISLLLWFLTGIATEWPLMWVVLYKLRIIIIQLQGIRRFFLQALVKTVFQVCCCLEISLKYDLLVLGVRRFLSGRA